MKKYLLGCTGCSTSSKGVSGALLFVRLVAGIAFILHGWGKIQTPFSWMGADAPVPGIFQFLAALAEFGGGICWVLGLLTPVASAGILATMAVAMMFHINKGDGFTGGWELAAVYFSLAVLFLCAGPGSYSVDAKLKKS